MKEPDSQRLERTRRLAEAVARVFCVRLKKTARRVGIIFQTGLVLLVVVGGLQLQWWGPPKKASAATGSYIEDFATTTYKDTTNTTAAWYGNGMVEVAATTTYTYGRWQNPNSGAMYGEDISCPSTNTCYIAANGATILKTTDGGSTWIVKHDTGTNFGILYGSGAVPGFYSIFAVNSNTVYAAGRLSSFSTSTVEIIVKTTDGGENWQQIYSGTGGYYLEDITCVDANNCFVAGGKEDDASKIVLTTSNGGSSWTNESLPAGSYDLYGITAFNDGASATIHAVGTGGKIIKGQGSAPPYTWVNRTTGTTINLYAVDCTTVFHCYAGGGSTAISTTVLRRSVNGGTSWSAVTHGYTAGYPVRIIDCSPNTTSTCWAISGVGSDGIRKSTNAGANWSAVSPAGGGFDDTYSNGLSVVSDTEAYGVAGVNGSGQADTVKTTDGTNWTDVDSNCCSSFSNAFLGVDMFDATTGWAVGWGQSVYKTTDGSTWSDVNFDGNSMRAVDFVTASVGWFVAVGGVVKKSADGGSSWTAQTCGGTCSLYNLNDIKMWNANVGYLVGEGGQVRYTTDGGASGWTAITPAPIMNSTDHYWNAVWVVNTTTVYVAGYRNAAVNGTIVKTTNSGTSWTSQLALGDSTIFRDISCLDAVGEKCWALTHLGLVYKTTNGGSSWSNVGDLAVGGTYRGRILFLSANNGFAVLAQYLFFTRDGGTTWTFASYSESEWEAIDNVRNNIWAVGGSGVIDKVVANYASSSIAQSTTIDTASGNITCADVSYTSDEPGSTSITLEMSNDGGSNWVTASGPPCTGASAMVFNFATTGSDLRWRATLTSGSPVSASLTEMTVTYSSNTAPNQPTNSTPPDAATATTLTPPLTSSAFSDPAPGATHGTSKWLIYNGAALVEDTGDSAVDLTSHIAPTLTQGTTS